MLLVCLLAGARTVWHTTTLRTDVALQAAFGLPGGAGQSVLADTLNAATDADVACLRALIAARYGQACRHDSDRALLVVGLDLSPLPASPRCEGAQRAWMGRCRSKTGRKLVRVRAAATSEVLWETVAPGTTVETLQVLQQAVERPRSCLTWQGHPGRGGAARADPVAPGRRLGQRPGCWTGCWRAATR